MDNFSSHLCLYCQKPIVGRIDKQFCDAQCRSSHHNKNRRPEERNIQLINRAIRKNRAILKKLSPNGKAVVRRELIESLGFTFQYFSSIYRSPQSVYYMNYDFGYRVFKESEKQKVQIIQQQAYHQSFDPWKYVKD